MFAKKSRLVAVLGWSFIAMCAYLPFHAVVSTWLISNVGHELIFKAWKEVVVMLVLLPLSAILLWQQRKHVFKNSINQCVAAFVALNVALAVLTSVGTKAELAGIAFNTRYFIFFLIAQVIALQFTKPIFKEFMLRVLFWGGVVVVVFGALQVLVLPKDILAHVGYQKAIIPPYFTVDNNQQLVRILSTLRGPNALGAYLVFWLPVLALVTRRMWNVATRYRYIAAVIWLASLITLYGSRSRSGYLGVLIALVVFVFLRSSKLWQKRLLIAGLIVSSLTAVLLAFNWNTRFVQVTIIHNDPTQGSGVNSNEQHANSVTDALHTIWSHPFGLGPGSTNIASTYGNNPRTVENYFLSIAVELGIVGLLLFIAILVLVITKLWQLRHDDIAAALLASFAGLLVVNLLLPAWGDETLSMLWWGMAGIVISTPLVKIKKRATV